MTSKIESSNARVAMHDARTQTQRKRTSACTTTIAFHQLPRPRSSAIIQPANVINIKKPVKKVRYAVTPRLMTSSVTRSLVHPNPHRAAVESLRVTNHSVRREKVVAEYVLGKLVGPRRRRATAGTPPQVRNDLQLACAPSRGP
ncbi:hypothetical protein EVAR_58780_1 [Eumeta japonica]|uniref:Uncharacterized protein n=1 Tax=Eumeta variegata TaxID=151549 RepID=A0A4C1YLH7_EUMVA|nr:hypothetical protein EVAR_58780_1 [Eumeta japonica]